MREYKNLYPLRKVLGTVSVKVDYIESMLMTKWKLECGHLLPPALDIYGERYPDKRRCPYCWAELSYEQRADLIIKSAKRIHKRKQKEWDDFKKYKRN